MSSKKNILYWNNCWFTNVGESFIDVGAMTLLKRIFPNGNIVSIGPMSNFYINNICGDNSFNKNTNAIDWFDIFEGTFDYIVFAGMYISESFFNNNQGSFVFLKKIAKAGAKVVFLGVGCHEYTENEIICLKNAIEELNNPLIVTRDNFTYEKLKDYTRCMRGLDCAFWCIDAYDPRVLRKAKYDVVTYNRSNVPKELLDENLMGKRIVTAEHMPFFMKERYIKPNMVISDCIFDYLTVYANADCVYTDLVHATIVSLMYGKKVKFKPVDNRRDVIESINILKRNDDWIFINEEDLKILKNDIEEKIIELL